ncbi:TIM-barrel domain-containing protein, partial [Undibacterium sp. 5I1]
TEPFEGDWKGIVKPEPWQRLLINAGELKKYLDPEHINAYSLLHSEGLYEGQRAAGNDKRVFLLTRSGFVGQQRYSAVTWSGDTSATWLALRRQISAGLNLCVTGTPYWTF